MQVTKTCCLFLRRLIKYFFTITESNMLEENLLIFKLCQGLGVFKLRDTNQEKEERLAPLYFDIWLSNFAVISNLFYFSPNTRLVHNSATLFSELMKRAHPKNYFSCQV